MSKKARLLAEEKVKIVEEYLNGNMGKATILTEYGTAWSTLRDWLRLYETRGIDGFCYSPCFLYQKIYGIYYSGELLRTDHLKRSSSMTSDWT